MTDKTQTVADAIRRVIIRDGELADVRDMANAAIEALTRQAQVSDDAVRFYAASLLRVCDNHARDIAEPLFLDERNELRAALSATNSEASDAK